MPHADVLPFSAEQFLAVFAAYNAAVWPAQIVAYVVELVAIIGMIHPGARSDRVVAAALAGMWLFTGIAYHWLRFTVINCAAYAFGAGFVLQAGLVLYAGSIGRLRLGVPKSRMRLATGLILILYVAILYPLIGIALHGYPAAPLFGFTPCPVTIFTLGCLLLTMRPVPWWVAAIPVLWSMIDGTAAFLLGMPQDLVLRVSGVVAALMLASARSQDPAPKLVPGERRST
jgi:hypothetical protein